MLAIGKRIISEPTRLLRGHCIYCGRPAGFLRKFHEECRDRHRRASSVIPGFFPKFFDSDLTVERFCELLHAAAEASFIKPAGLRTIAATGVSKMVRRILKQRLPTNADITRIVKIMEGLGDVLSEDPFLQELFAKADILAQLDDGTIPELITVVGAMPIEMRRGESIIWIFNHVTSYVNFGPVDIAGDSAGFDLELDKVAYYGVGKFRRAALPRGRLREEGFGDLIVTNRNLYMLTSETESRRIPLARINSMRAYAEGVFIACDPSAERTRTFALSDSWFAANLVVRLVQLARPNNSR